MKWSCGLQAPQTPLKGHLPNPFQLGAELKEWPSPHFYGRKLSLRPTLIGIVDLWTIFVVLRCFEYAESKVHIHRWLAMDSLQELPCPGVNSTLTSWASLRFFCWWQRKDHEVDLREKVTTGSHGFWWFLHHLKHRFPHVAVKFWPWRAPKKGSIGSMTNKCYEDQVCWLELNDPWW